MNMAVSFGGRSRTRSSVSWFWITGAIRVRVESSCFKWGSNSLALIAASLTAFSTSPNTAPRKAPPTNPAAIEMMTGCGCGVMIGIGEVW